MQFRFGELPDDHVFLFAVRPLVDWSFKLITWLGIAATFRVAAELTNSPYLWATYAAAQLLIIFFLQSFMSWLFRLKRYGDTRNSFSAPATTESAKWRKRATRILTTIVFAVAIWLPLALGMQVVVDQVVSAIVEFQKKAGH